MEHISIHALRVEGDLDSIRHLLTPSISIHALRVEGDAPFGNILTAAQDFYPRPPGGGRLKAGGTGLRSRNFYPRPPGGGRPFAMMYPP